MRQHDEQPGDATQPPGAGPEPGPLPRSGRRPGTRRRRGGTPWSPVGGVLARLRSPARRRTAVSAAAVAALAVAVVPVVDRLAAAPEPAPAVAWPSAAAAGPTSPSPAPTGSPAARPAAPRAVASATTVTRPAPTPTRTSPSAAPATPPGGVAQPEVRSYEAEHPANVFGGHTRPDAVAGASGGQVVRWIGDGSRNTLRFTGVEVPRADRYQVRIHYLTAEPRRAAIRVNGDLVTVADFPATGRDWHSVGTITLRLPLAAGRNEVQFGNRFDWAPDLDRIDLTG